MSISIRKTVLGAALIACLLLASAGAHALRDDRVYQVLVICEGDCSELSELDALRDEIAAVLPPGPSSVWPTSAADLAAMPYDDLPAYSFAVWHFRGSLGASATELDQAARRLLAAEVPVIVFDGAGFPIASALGLTTAVSGGVYEEPFCAHADTLAGGAFHNVLSDLVEVDASEVVYSKPLDGDHVRGNYVDRAAVDADAFTRPVMSAGDYAGPYDCAASDEDPDRVLVIVNDRKRIVASGIHEHGAYAPPFLLHNMVEYVTAVGPESAMSDWIDQPALGSESESILFSPGGQSVLVESDWTRPSRGIDFEIRRTYRSGAADLYSCLGENWYLSHDRYLVHDRVNGQLLVHDGSGGVTAMVRVAERTPGGPDGGGRDTYVAIGSTDTAIAAYYDYTEEHALTRVNPFFGEFVPGDQLGNIAKCVATDHASDAILEQWTSGFVLRDASGNLAYYQYHPIDDEDPDGMAYGNQKLRTKGGNLAYYRLAYLQDRNGNRQDYYYAHTDPGDPATGEHATPEALLWCVVDTEDRGTFFEMDWAQTQMDGRVSGSQGPRLPWLSKVYFFDDYEDGAASPSLLYGYLDDGSGCGLDATYHGLLLDKVSLWRGGADETVYKLYDYDFWAYDDPDLIGCGAGGWGNHYVPLEAATDWVQSPAAQPSTRFEYAPPATDTCNATLEEDNACGFAYDRYYQGPLVRYVAGREASGFPGETPTETEHRVVIRPGTPDHHDLDEPYGWVSTLKNGVGQTLVFNGSFRVIERRLWYTPERCPDGDDSAGPVDCTDVDLAEAPGACADWETGWPQIPCEGQSWAWRYRYNHDGQLVWSRTPVWQDNKWIDVEVQHVFEWALENELGGIAEDEAVGDQLLAFWEELWPQRQWMANPVMTTTHGWEGQQIETLTTYDPVFNRPLLVEKQGAQQRRFNYDYLAFAASPLSDEALFSLMHLPHATLASWHLSSCPYGDCRLNMLDPAALPFGECLEPVAPGPLQDPSEGNLVCEEAPHTQSYGLSVGRAPAAATFEYDQHGRVTRTENLDGRVVAEEYVSDPTDGTVRTVSRLGLGASPAIQTRYFYDAHGQNVRKQMAVDGPLDEAGTRCVEERFAYDGLGRLTHSWLLEDDDCATSGGEVVIGEEIHEHDAAGNPVATRTVRCPNDDSCLGGETAVGDLLDRVRLYDSKRRNTWDCREIEQSAEPAGTVFTCTVRGYGADDRLVLEGRLDHCLVAEGDDLEVALLGCAGDWFDLRLVREHGYDERRLRHRTRLFDPTGETAERITRAYHDVDGRLVATHDAADSDCSGPACDEPEWSASEYDGLGRLRRVTRGLDSADPLGTADAVADWYGYDDFDRVVRESRGAPIAGGAVDRSLGETDYAYDARGSLIVRREKAYPVGGSPDEADVIAVFYSYDQNDRVELERRYDHDAGLDLSLASYHDAYGRLQLVETASAGAEVAAIYREHDHLGRVIDEQRADYSQLGSVGDLATEIELGYDGAGRLVYRAEIDAADDPGPPHETIDRYDGLGYLTETIDARGQPTRYDRDGLGAATRVAELLPGESWYFTDGFGSDPAVYGQLENVVEYDGLGGVVRRTDDKGNATEYRRNAFGEVVEIDSPGATGDGVFDNQHQERYTRNGDGAITRIAHYWNSTSPDDEPVVELDLELDRLNRPRIVRDGDAAELQAFQYDGNGNLVVGFDHNNAIPEVDCVRTDRRFDTRGELLSDRTAISAADGVDSWEATSEHVGGRLSRVLTPSGVDVRHEFWTTSPLLERVTVRRLDGEVGDAGAYYWVGERPLRRYQIVDEELYLRNRMDWGGAPAYDGFGRQVRSDVRRFGDAAGTIARFDLTYNENDRLVDEDRVKGGVGRDLSYVLDDLDRVETYLAGDAADQYYLDQADNVRQSATGAHGQVELEIDRGVIDDGDPGTSGPNQVTAMVYLDDGGYRRTFEYDARGNLTFDLGPPEEGSRALTWDDHGRLVRVEHVSGKASTFAYDALGRRVRKLVRHDDRRTDRHDYRLLGDDVVEEIRRLGWKDEELWVFVHDPTAVDRCLRWDRYHLEGGSFAFDESYAPVVDARNNVLAVISNSDPVELEYSLFGEEIDPDHGQYVPYRFAGRRFDEDTGLYYYRSRYYAPDLGRFLSPDTIGVWGDLNNYGNGYAYVGNMSNSLLDPTGEIESGPGWKPLPGSEPHPERVDVKKDFRPLWIWMDDLVRQIIDKVTFGEGSRQEKIRRDNLEQQQEEKTEKLENRVEDLEENDDQQDDFIQAMRDYWEALCGDRSGCVKDENGNWVPRTGGSGGMPAPDGEGFLTREDIYFLSMCGQLQVEPRRPQEPGEYEYDRPGNDIWAFRNRKWKRKKLYGSDDGRFYFGEMLHATHTDWEQRLSLHDPGVVDPIPRSRTGR